MNLISKNIKHLRSIKNINQVQLGQVAGILQSKISRIENGMMPDHQDAVAIASYFGITAEMLLKEDLVEKFRSLDHLQAWVDHEQEDKNKRQQYLNSVSAAPLMIRAIQRHYVRSLSDLTGKPQDEIYQEIQAIFDQLKAEHLSNFQSLLPSQTPE